MKRLLYLSAGLLCLGSLSSGAQLYSIEDVGTLSSDPNHEVRAHGINNRGHVHGENDLAAPAGAGKTNGFFWDGHQLHKILPLVPALSFGGGINDADQCVGYSSAGGVKIHALSWEGGVTSDIHSGGLEFSHANDVNAAGWVVGTNSDFVPGYFISQFRPYLRAPAGGWIDLGTLGGGSGFAEAVNDHQSVVGTARNASEQTRGFYYSQATGMLELPTFGGPLTDPRDIDNQERVVGGSMDASSSYRPFVMLPGGMLDLGTLGGPSGTARAINEHGEIVGASKDAGDVQRATLWSGGQVHDLNALIPAGSGWDLTGARGINELGEIAGTGWIGGHRRAYRLTPILGQPRLSGFQPGIAGVHNALFGMGFQPGAVIFLAVGIVPGSTPLPGCAGVALDMLAPYLLALVLADADGRIELPLGVPASVAGIPLLLQAVDPVACELSELRPQSFQ